jgi:gephyrin
MVLEARRLVDQWNPTEEGEDLPVQALNALGYEEAAQHVYGMHYEEWKQRHQKKATNEELERYQASEPLQAKHDKDLLAKRSNEKPPKRTLEHPDARESTAHVTIASNVCCQNVEEVAASVAEKVQVPAKHTRVVPPFTPPPIPSKFKVTTASTTTSGKPFVSIAVLTVSDRAANNEYEHGDLSGAAVCQSVRELTGWDVSTVAIVPDDSAAIQAKIKTWSSITNNSNDPIDLILTTGGTGFSPRDITPEATKEVVDHELPNLVTFCVTECSHIQPLSSLSRGTAGILNSTVIANLPGNPKSIGEILPLLLPLLLHAVADMQESSETPEVAEIG